MADWVSPITGEELILTKEGLRDSFQEYGVFPDGIPNLIYPAVLEKRIKNLLTSINIVQKITNATFI